MIATIVANLAEIANILKHITLNAKQREELRVFGGVGHSPRI